MATTRIQSALLVAFVLTLVPCSSASVRANLMVADEALAQRISFARAFAEATESHLPRHSESTITLAGGSSTARFDATGAVLDLAGRPLRIHLSALGRSTATDLEPLLVVPPTIEGVEVSYQRALGVREWWRGLSGGLEHGVTLDHRVSGSGHLVLELAVTGADVTQNEGGVRFLDEAGQGIGRYEGLLVLDARGERVPAAMVADTGGIRIEIDDARARYPLVIDPFVGVEEAILRSPTNVGGERLGVSVALDETGTRLAVGATEYGSTSAPIGRVLVFLRSGTLWTFEAELIDPMPTPGTRRGRSVAITAAGDRIVSGGLGGHPSVFSRVGTSWSFEATLGESPLYGGREVAISADGSVAAVGRPSQPSLASATNSGMVGVYRRTTSTWTFESALRHPTAAQDDMFGDDLALSADGTSLIIGCAGDDEAALDAGSAWVSRDTGSGFSTLSPLPTTGLVFGDGFGTAVAVSDDGEWVLVGASGVGGADHGAVFPFRWSGSSWTQGSPLAGPTSMALFARSVAISNDGTRALVSASRDDSLSTDAGMVISYGRTGTTWAESARLFPSGGSAASGIFFGQSVALAGDGSRAAVGAYTDRVPVASAGSVRVFAEVGGGCTADAECTSGHCSDGVCCDTACGGGASDDCQACAAALTGGVTGRCAPLAAGVASGVVCRAAAGICDRPEVCAAGVLACPSDGFVSGSSTCRPARDTCDAAEVCAGTGPNCPLDALRPANSTCRSSMGVCDPLEVCDGSSDACPSDLRSTSVCRGSAGDCDLPESCDGVAATCPADARRGTETTCRDAAGPCDRAEVCGGGVSCPANTFLTGVCRASEGLCDPAESCTGSTASCPSDARHPSGSICRGSADTCDPAEVCDGLDVACPADGRTPAGTMCRGSAGACDPSEACDGSAAACPPDLRQPSGVSCRGSAGVCDTAEVCDGTGVACPGDGFLPAGSPCGGGEPGSCAAANTCTGSSASCPSTMGVLPSGRVCLAASPDSPCDIDDECDGVTSDCIARFADSRVACGSAPSGACDAPDHCAGTSADCVDAFLEGVECRPAAGACDTPEFCGSAASCPADAVLASGVSCRASVDDRCDPVESCDGVASTCPADEQRCSSIEDAGPSHDAGPGSDTGTEGSDAGAPLAATGCACRHGSTSSRDGLPAIAGLALLAVVLRRRR